MYNVVYRCNPQDQHASARNVEGAPGEKVRLCREFCTTRTQTIAGGIPGHGSSKMDVVQSTRGVQSRTSTF